MNPLKLLLVSTTLAALAGCNSTSTDNALATLSKNNLPVACDIVKVAEGYFTTLRPKISVANQKIETGAAAAAASICGATPPTDVNQAFADLYNAWMAVQNATVSQ